MKIHKATHWFLFGAWLLGACQGVPTPERMSTPVLPTLATPTGQTRPATTPRPSPIPSPSPTATSELAPLPVCRDAIGSRPEELTLTFAAEWDGDLEIYSIHADGSDLMQFTSNTTDDLDPAWSPDGRQLAYIEWNSGLEERLVVADAESRQRRVLVPESLGPIVHPTWSPSGDRIAFRNLRDLYAVEVESGEAFNLTATMRPFPLELSFSADGRMLAFNAQSDVAEVAADVNRTLFVIGSDGTALRELTFPGVELIRRPSWHPSKDLILFEGSGPIEGFQFYLTGIDGAIEEGVRQATHQAVFPAWSPDGSMIAYVARTFASLHVLAWDEGVDILSFELPAEPGAELLFLQPIWGPDSRHIAYTVTDQNADTEGVDLHVLDICDGMSVLIADAIWSSSSLSWRPGP